MKSPPAEVSGPPAGFRALSFKKGFMQVNGPIYMRPDADDGGVRFGSLIEARHCNGSESAHGGFLMTFMDMVLPLTVGWELDRPGPFLTVSLSGDYVGTVPVGSWLEGKGRMVRATRSLAFADGVASVNGEIMFRASIICRLPRVDAGKFTPREMYGRLKDA
jgi:acyl-coenzyme A thioesterase PaaI-like protein